ncbi:FAD-dependent monooxygenase [Kitasatospora sp. NPDC089797]|uniref:FAD-dependent monooxygenase n=1 Tax=Kitasatospora sp. NPDC089797 TaxID=3155298 RepID=UPI0034419122
MRTDAGTGTGAGTGTDFDVVVAGGGPVGLMLACELRLAGTSVLVVERLTAVDETIKAGAINTPSVEAFYRRGLLPALEGIHAQVMENFIRSTPQRRPDGPPAGNPAPADGAAPPRMPGRVAGHFAGIMLSLDRFDPADDPDFADRGPVDKAALIPQAALEHVLGERAAELGVELRRGVELTGFDADEHGVTVHLDGAAPVRTGWLVGCDGGRSTVRRLTGIDFPGTAPEITGHQAMVEMTGSEGLNPGWNRTAVGTYVHGPMPGRILTVEFDGPPADRQSPVTAEELQTSLRNVSGVDVTITGVHSATRFTDNARQAGTYRAGRVLLAGDAAHVHSPFGGQGLNLGIGDAINLGWKLAATVQGWAPEGLLDSYTAERHPIGAWVLDWTRAQVALMRPEPGSGALRDVVTQLADTVAGTTYFVKQISGVWQRYDLPGEHPLVGRSAPDLELADGSRLADHLHDGRALLLDLTDDPALRARADGHRDRLRIVTSRCPGRAGLAALLVRPDGFVAWAGDSGQAPDGLDEALDRWLGAARAGLDTTG